MTSWLSLSLLCSILQAYQISCVVLIQNLIFMCMMLICILTLDMHAYDLYYKMVVILENILQFSRIHILSIILYIMAINR